MSDDLYDEEEKQNPEDAEAETPPGPKGLTADEIDLWVQVYSAGLHGGGGSGSETRIEARDGADYAIACLRRRARPARKAKRDARGK